MLEKQREEDRKKFAQQTDKIKREYEKGMVFV